MQYETGPARALSYWGVALVTFAALGTAVTLNASSAFVASVANLSQCG